MLFLKAAMTLFLQTETKHMELMKYAEDITERLQWLLSLRFRHLLLLLVFQQ